MQMEHRISTSAPAADVFRIYREVDKWHTWDPDTRAAWIDGPFAAGASGRLTPAKGRAVPMTLTEVVPGKSFTAECRIPLLRMRFEHELRPAGGGTEIVHRVTLTGLLSHVVGPALFKQLDKGLPATLANLKRLVESTA